MANLRRISQGWYARYIIPRSRWADFGGKREVVRTLQTRDLVEARSRRLKAMEAIEACQSALNWGSDSILLKLTCWVPWSVRDQQDGEEPQSSSFNPARIRPGERGRDRHSGGDDGATINGSRDLSRLWWRQPSSAQPLHSELGRSPVERASCGIEAPRPAVPLRPCPVPPPHLLRTVRGCDAMGSAHGPAGRDRPPPRPGAWRPSGRELRPEAAITGQQRHLAAGRPAPWKPSIHATAGGRDR